MLYLDCSSYFKKLNNFYLSIFIYLSLYLYIVNVLKNEKTRILSKSYSFDKIYYGILRLYFNSY